MLRRKLLAMMFLGAKMNENHDEKGRFASGSGGDKYTKGEQLAIHDLEKKKASDAQWRNASPLQKATINAEQFSKYADSASRVANETMDKADHKVAQNLHEAAQKAHAHAENAAFKAGDQDQAAYHADQGDTHAEKAVEHRKLSK